MEMRSLGSIEGPGTELTTQLPPLASSLSDPFLHSHCSSCFRPLLSITAAPNLTPTLYCSQRCSHLDTPLHFSSAEHHLFLFLHSHPTIITSTSDLRLALRLLHHFHRLSLLPSHPTDRIGGLLTNLEKLKHQDEIYERIKEGGRLMARARRRRDGVVAEEDIDESDDTWVEEMVLGTVLTNAVEVQVDDKQGVGVAVYGKSFSWINHSCVPNACYRFSMFGSNDVEGSKTRIGAFGDECAERDDDNELSGYGPRIVVRSIKPIKKGEEVCVAYTDLLQPKATRQGELWSRYIFICCCRRCHASPPTYVDRVLLGNCVANFQSTILSQYHSFCNDDAYEELSSSVDEIIDEYLSTGNPESCCEKLENMLIQYPRKELSQPEEQSLPTFKLHPLHHLSLSAYITLSSAYKIRASELLSSPTVTENHSLEAFKLSRTSAAYSLLHAGACHHLFLSERCLVISAAHFWISAGESLITLARSLIQDSNSSVSSLLSRILGKCSVMNRLKTLASCNHTQRSSTEIEFQDLSKGFTNCASRLSSKVWPFLIEGRQYFEDIKDPINFTLPDTNTCTWRVTDGHGCGFIYETKNESNEESVFELGAHCLLYGAYLGSICYGRGCYLTNYVTNQ